MKVVEIRKIALVQIVAAVCECGDNTSAKRRVEAQGFLGGDAKREHLIVKLAQAAQIVDRKPGSLYYDEGWKRIREIISRNYDFLGGFHSHLRTIIQEKLKKRADPGRVLLGKTDVATIMDEYPEGIEIVVAMNPSRIKMGARIPSDFRIMGYITNGRRQNYRLEIGAYYLDESLRKRRAELHVSRRDLNAVFS